jgi:hypothetical protein
LSFPARAQSWLEDLVLDVVLSDDVYVDHGVSGGRGRGRNSMRYWTP